MGDRSENADYIYGKKRLREIDRRVRYLRKRLEEMIVVSDPPDDVSKIYFGATVTLEDDEENSVRYRLVGPDEINPQLGYISIDAPLGRIGMTSNGMDLRGKTVDSEIEIESPIGRKRYCVLAIDYSGSSD